MHNFDGRKATLSVAEFCSAIGCGRTTFYAQVARGNIRVLKLGTRTLVWRPEITFLETLAAGIARCLRYICLGGVREQLCSLGGVNHRGRR